MPNQNSDNGLVKKAPNNVLVICISLLAAVVVLCLTFLAYNERDTDALIRYVNTLLNAVGVLLGAGAFIYSGSAAKRANDVANTVENGEFDKRIRRAVSNVLSTDTQEGREATQHGRSTV